MRRVTLLCAVMLTAMISASCQHDGRTLREPRPDQNSTISTTVPVTADTTGFADPGFDDPGDDADDTKGIGSGIDGESSTTSAVGAELTVTAPWRNGARIDARHSCDGLDVAPPLSWTVAPEGTAEIAITMADLDAPDYVHWVIAGLGPQTVAIAEDTVPIGAVEATNTLGDIGYTGPCPDGSSHTYVIRVHYLGQLSGLGDGESGADMMARIEELEIASAVVKGTFSRP